ncbi:MAG TPA: 2-oxoacid:acceptor oxidoreductase family protein [Planctomycetota bacterium]|nr:2-oxoacid:acceptor oxidoreductase family protein [Planctomycetota bacterium]
MNKELRFTGFGGQGIILAGYITGKAAAIYADLYATLTQNYGPESRGGASSAQLIISNEPIFYPNITRPDILVAMSQEGYAKYRNELNPDGIMLIDEDLVKISETKSGVKIAKVPATRLAEQLGKKMVANIVMLGFMAGQTRVLPRKVMEEAIKTSVPPASIELNMKAFDMGFSA